MWVNALRSGGYKQGGDVLHYQDDSGEQRFCCLGVLCDLAYAHNVVKREEGDELSAYRQGISDARGWKVFHYGWGGSVVDLPHEVVEWAGLPTCGEDDPDDTYFNQGDPFLTSLEFRHPRHISYFNDSGYDFNTIADLIEAQL